MRGEGQPISDLSASSLLLSFSAYACSSDDIIESEGQDEIESMAKVLKENAKALPKTAPRLLICTLYGALAAEQQLEVFKPAPAGHRKVILATNIAETSLTINGIVYVIDTGMVKQKTFNPRTQLDTLRVRPISRAQANQRTGRAGREAAGWCFRLFTEAAFETLDLSTVPEILRCSMATIVLQLKVMGVKNPVEFDFISSPSEDSFATALGLLFSLGALNESMELTSEGRRLAQFPLDPKHAKVIVASEEFGCSAEILSIVALLSVETIFTNPTSKREQANKIRSRFLAPQGDHITLLNVYRTYVGEKNQQQWCHDHFINARSMATVVNVRAQLKAVCNRLGVTLESCNGDTVLMRKALLSGLFVNVAILQPDRSFKTLKSGQTAQLHPSSALFGMKPRCVLYDELIETSKRYLRGCSLLDNDWLSEVVPVYFAG